VGTAPAFASVGEALDMVRAGLGYLAAADAARLPAATQAECLAELERHDAMAAAARASFLAAFTAGAGPAGDGDYSAVSWLIHRTGITRGAAVGHSAWAKRAATHPKVLAALAAGQVSLPASDRRLSAGPGCAGSRGFPMSGTADRGDAGSRYDGHGRDGGAWWQSSAHRSGSGPLRSPPRSPDRFGTRPSGCPRSGALAAVDGMGPSWARTVARP
jgi:hypothetical protein